MSPSAYIGFGSNLGDRESKFKEALRALGSLPVTIVKAHSRLYETEPMGLSDHGFKFLNAAVALETDLSPVELMKMIRDIELDLGKSPSHRSDMSRVIDLDLLFVRGRTYFRERIGNSTSQNAPESVRASAVGRDRLPCRAPGSGMHH